MIYIYIYRERERDSFIRIMWAADSYDIIIEAVRKIGKIKLALLDRGLNLPRAVFNINMIYAVNI